MKSSTILKLLLSGILASTCIAFISTSYGVVEPARPADQKANPISSAGAPFRDVLDTHAAKSIHAAQTLLISVAIAGKRVICVGQHGHIVYSDDQGKSWTQANVPVSSDLLAVHFPSTQRGWAVGHDGVVLNSTDGGANWNKQFDGRAAAQVMASRYMGSNSCSSCHGASDTPEATPSGAGTSEMMAEIRKFVDQGPDKPFLDVWFENETTGFIVGAFNMIFRTVDGGKVWEPWYDRIDNPKHLHLYSIRQVGGDLFITSEQGTVFKLDQSKQRFKALKSPYAGTFFGITGKPGSVIAYGMRGNAYRSRNGGDDWQKVETGEPAGLLGGTVSEDGRVFLASQGGHVLMSSDDGSSFSQLKIDQTTPLASLAALDKNTLALVGQRGVKIQTIK